MKKIILPLIVIFIICCATDCGDSKIYTYTIRNESGKDIKIEGYIKRSPSVTPVITKLDIGEELTKTFEDFNPPKRYSFCDFFDDDNGHRDSVVIIYDNSKFNNFIKIGCRGSDRNPLNFCIYSGVDETFTFTTQDYEDAIDCGGNCK